MGEKEIENVNVTSLNDENRKELFRMNRRTFVKIAGATAGALAFGRLGFRMAAAAQSPQIPLAGSAIPQFVDPLPDLDAIVAGTSQIELQMTEFLAQVLPTGLPKTSVWGYLQTGQTTRLPTSDRSSSQRAAPLPR